jgi:CPA2 family monovalent cation:H+ antiporter-2
MVITFDEPDAVTRTLAAAKYLHPAPEVLVRTRDDSHFEMLLGRGAHEVIPETLEASLALADHLLRRLDYAKADIQPLLDSIRRDGYRELRSTFAAGEDTQRASAQPGLQTICVTAHAYAVGRRLSELDLAGIGVKVVAIRRSGIRGDEPLQDTRLRADDALVIEGTIAQLDRARQRVLGG